MPGAGEAAAAQAEVPPPLIPPEADPDEVREAIDEILRGPEFQEPARSIPQRIIDWVLDRFADVVGTLVAGGRGAVVGWVVLVLAVAAIVVLLTRLAAGLRRDPARSGERPVVEVRRPAREWRAEAEGHEAAGRWREALRCRYRALVADLAAAGLVEEVPGRTAGEYRSQVDRNLPRAASDFAAATAIFESAWYGNRGAAPSHAERLRDLEGRVLAGAGR